MDLLYFDLYGLAPSILYRQKKKFKTYLGLFFTLITALVFTLLLAFYTHKMISKTRPQVIQSTVIDINPSRFELNGQNFAFLGALETSAAEFYIDESVYSLRMYQISHIKGEDGIYIKTSTPIKTKVCSEINSELVNSTFSHLPLDYLYCPDPEETANMQGIFGSQVYNSISAEVVRCNPKERKCKSEQEIDAILEGGYFGFFLSGIIFDPSNPHEPFKKFSDNYFTTISSNEFKMMNLRTNKNISNTDFGILTEEFREVTDFSLDFYKENVRPGKSENIVWMNMFFNNKTRKFNRSYPKIQQVAAEMGALIKILILTFGWIARFIGEKHLYVKICEDLSFSRKKPVPILELESKNSNSPMKKRENKAELVPKNKTKFVLTSLICCKSKASKVYGTLKSKIAVIKERLNITSFLELEAELNILKKVFFESHQLRMLQYLRENTDNLVKQESVGEYRLFEQDIARMKLKPTEMDKRIVKLIQDFD